MNTHRLPIFAPGTLPARALRSKQSSLMCNMFAASLRPTVTRSSLLTLSLVPLSGFVFQSLSLFRVRCGLLVLAELATFHELLTSVRAVCYVLTFFNQHRKFTAGCRWHRHKLPMVVAITAVNAPGSAPGTCI